MGKSLATSPILRGRTLSKQAGLPGCRILAQLRKIFTIHKHIASNTLRSHPPKDVEIRNFFSLFCATPYAILVFINRERIVGWDKRERGPTIFVE
jgi:hypothetical protein